MFPTTPNEPSDQPEAPRSAESDFQGEASGRECHDPNRSLLGAWEATLGRLGEIPAVLGIDGTTARTFRQIEDEARDLEGRWSGLPGGAVVAVQIGNDPAWPAVFLALLRGGRIVLPLVDGAPVPPFAHAVVETGTVLSERHRDTLGGMQAAVLKLTSGTTGEPRAIRFTAAQIAADCEHICSTMGIGADDINFGAISLPHSYGFSNLLTPLLLKGTRLVLTNERLPRAIYEGLVRTRATVFPGNPVFFQHLANLDAPAPPALRLCISAGAPLGRAEWQRFYDRFGLKIHTFYGSSECGGIAYDREGALPEEGFVGQAMDGVTIVPREDGRIVVRGAAVGEGYFPEPDGATLSGGCFVPGDLVRISEGGMTIEGRASDVINVAGRKLNPAEVEQKLAAYPGVRKAVVFGAASRLRGEEPVACVEGEGIDARELLRHCGRELAAWQVPRDVWLVPEIPADERGKISRRALAAAYAGRQKEA